MSGNTATKIVNEAAARAGRDRVARIALVLMVLFLAVAGVYFGPRAIQQGNDIDSLRVQSQANATAANQNAMDGQKLAEQVRALGGTPIVEPAPPTAQATPPPPSGLSTQQVRDLVNREIAGKAVTVADVLALVTNVYNANRPADGRNATTEQVLSAVQAVCANDVCRGPSGKDGEDAPPVTDAQIFAQVAQFCGSRNECAGPGGPQGVGQVKQEFVRVDGTCVSRVTYEDPANGSRRTEDSPAGDAACPDVVPPSSPPSSEPELPIPTN